MTTNFPVPLPPAEEGRGPTLLVADDNEGLTEVWSYVLADLGYEVTTARTGSQALRAAAGRAFDVAVLDLQLPDVSGLEVFTALRADLPELEGIIVTGNASMDSAIEAVNRGVYAYMVKPVSPEELSIMVRRALERGRLFADNGRMLAHLRALQDVMDAALEGVGLEDALQRMLKAVVGAMGVDCASLLLGEANGSLAVAAAYPAQLVHNSEGFDEEVFAGLRPRQAQRLQANVLDPGPSGTAKGVCSLLGVPVFSGERVLGVLRVTSLGVRRYEDAEVRLMDSLGQRVAMAVEKSRLLAEREVHLHELEKAYARERRIAETLQRAFLPGVRLQVPGVAVAHLYQAALQESEVGGDLYDVIELDAGRVGLVMGDVSGKGLDAAVYTALAKYTLRGYALEDPDPVRAMERLNRAFVRQSDPEAFATLFYGLLDVTTGRLTYVNAGHEPALLYDPAAETATWLHATGPVAGVFPDTTYEAAEAQLAPGALLLLYTDGASDARSGHAWLGTHGLQQLLAENLHPDLQETLAGVYAGILRFASQKLRDDTALLLISRGEGRSAAPGFGA